MRKLFPLLLLCLHAAAQDAAPDGKEFLSMRMEYAKKADAELDWGTNKEREEFLKIYANDKKGFVEAASKWLAKCPIDSRVHLMMAYALSDLGRTAETVKHRYYFYGLLQSIIGDKDGLSKKSAWKVVSVDEEYDVCRYLSAKVGKQSLDGGYDVLEVDIKGEKKELYFDASIPLMRTAKMIGK